MSRSSWPSEGQNSYFIDVENAGEMARLLKQSRVITHELGGLFPDGLDLSRVRNVVDIACGPGEWVHAVAQAHPEMQVVGIDLSRTMIHFAQAISTHLPHAQFQVMDATGPLDFPTASCDLIHARLTFGFLPVAAWSGYLHECCRILRPGGILLLIECEAPITNQPAVEEMTGLFTQAARRAGQSFSPDGRTIGITPMLGRLLKDAGLQDLHSQASAIDFSAGTPLHQDFLENQRISFHLMQPFLVQMGVTSPKKAITLYQRSVQEMRAADLCALWYFLRIWGRKPV